MEYEKTPKAVANLITLAEGTRPRVDPRDGAVRTLPFFVGQTFFGVVNDASTKLVETGSPSGNDTDEPGYTFPDEFHPDLTHVPYVLSMSNRGPNTNGARFCFTGNLELAERDNRNTVFGKVLSAASRAVVDNILAAGSNATAITAMQVRATDPAAAAFDALAVPLPIVQAMTPKLVVVPGVSVSWIGNQPVSSMLRVYQSTDLHDWSPHFQRMVGLDEVLPPGGQQIDNADVPRRFYRFSLVSCPDAGGVSGFANRKLTIQSPGIGTLIYQFDASGTSGTYENILLPGEEPFFAGPFQLRSEIPAVMEPYSFRVLLYSSGLGGAPFNLISGGFDSIGPASVSGHHVTGLYSAGMALVFEDTGSFTLTRP
jgi:peptidyl-prolyl cis-trans isomerase A (cyclophilin A)